MSTFRLEIRCDNAAFEENPSLEVARILRESADKIEAGVPVQVLRDINGNRVGSAEFEIE